MLLKVSFSTLISDSMALLKYFRSILITFLICWLIFIGAIFYQMGAPTEASSWTYRTYLIKSNLAKSTNTPKLIVISGSNGLYGISCQMIQEKTRLTCVNAATGVTLGIDYLLRGVRSWVKPGDLVIFPLEYEYYAYNGIPESSFVDYVFSRDPNYLKSLDLVTQIRFISGLTFERLQEGIRIKSKSSQFKDIVAKSREFNEYGDEAKNRESSMSKDVLNRNDRYTPNQLLLKTASIHETQGMKTISDFVNWCHQNNIKIIATWPSTVWFDAYQDSKQQEFFQDIEEFYQKLGVPLLGKARDFMYPQSMFFNSSYHLHDRGRSQRTQQVLDLLEPYLQDFYKSIHQK